MYGIWLLILFVILPGAVGGALSYVLSSAERPSNKILALGAAIGIAAGLILALFFVRI